MDTAWDHVYCLASLSEGVLAILNDTERCLYLNIIHPGLCLSAERQYHLTHFLGL